MAKLTAKKRTKLLAKTFALAGRRYPVQDKAHARNALARVSQHGTAAEKAAVRKKVKAKFPGIAVTATKRATKKRITKKGGGRKRMAK